jgi:methionine aminopeptidase
MNEEAIHGIPGERAIRSGVLVKLDLVAVKDGFYADAAVTIRAGEVSATADADALRDRGFLSGLAIGARGQPGIRDWPCGRTGNQAVWVSSAARSLRPWRWPDHS